MASIKSFTAEQMIDALTRAEGFVSVAAKMLGCSVKTIERYIAEYPTVAAARHESKFKRDDFVEAQIMKRIKAGSDTMIIFYAKTQMKGRGYVERTETMTLTLDPHLLDLATDDELDQIKAGGDMAAIAAGIQQRLGRGGRSDTTQN